MAIRSAAGGGVAPTGAGGLDRAFVAVSPAVDTLGSAIFVGGDADFVPLASPAPPVWSGSAGGPVARAEGAGAGGDVVTGVMAAAAGRACVCGALPALAAAGRRWKPGQYAHTRRAAAIATDPASHLRASRGTRGRSGSYPSADSTASAWPVRRVPGTPAGGCPRLNAS